MPEGSEVSSLAVLFRGIDRASFATALAMKLREAGVGIDLSTIQMLCRGLARVRPGTKADMYWLTRVSFVRRQRDVELFDRVFDEIFDSAFGREGMRARDSHPNQQVRSTGSVLKRVPLRITGPGESGSGATWQSSPRVHDSADALEEVGAILPLLFPSEAVGISDRPFDQLEPNDLREMERLLERELWQWPTRPGQRRRPSNSRGQISMRATLREAGRTQGEVVNLVRTKSVSRARKMVVILDVSGSMEPYVRAYLHVCRVLLGRGPLEVFSVGTRVHRLTPALRHRSVGRAMQLATAEVEDLFGGTRLATSLRELLSHSLWGCHLRDAIVVIASDGWDSDGRHRMTREMSRLSRHTHSIIWLNPRKAATGYEPLVESMAAALPFCDRFLSGHSANAMVELLRALESPT